MYLYREILLLSPFTDWENGGYSKTRQQPPDFNSHKTEIHIEEYKFINGEKSDQWNNVNLYLPQKY